jgi:hypothetical protein
MQEPALPFFARGKLKYFPGFKFVAFSFRGVVSG